MGETLYVCNRKKCNNCSDDCFYTRSIKYAKNFDRFKINQNVYYAEKRTEDSLECLKKITLPCTIGDTVYKILSYGEIVEFVVVQINTFTTKYEKTTFLVYDGKSEPTIGIIGLDTFVSKEQAEAKLKELQSKENKDG